MTGAVAELPISYSKPIERTIPQSERLLYLLFRAFPIHVPIAEAFVEAFCNSHARLIERV
jgi:hypothetical protein